MSAYLKNDIAPPLRLRLRNYVFYSTVFSLLFAVMSLLGWTLDNQSLKSIHFSWVSMKANTAISIILISIALLFSFDPTKRRSSLFRRIFSALALGLGAATFFQYLLGVSFGIDEFFFKDASSFLEGHYPGRMAISTSLSISLLGLSLFFLEFEVKQKWRPAEFLSAISLIMTLPPLIFYIYGVPQFTETATFMQMAIHTAICLSFLSVGIFFIRPDKGFVAFIFSESPAGLMLRQLIPAALGVPLILGGLMISGERAGYYSINIALALTVVMCVVSWIAVLVATAKQLLVIDHARYQMELEKDRIAHQREQERARFETILETFPLGVILAEAPSGRLIYTNHQVAPLLHLKDLQLNSIQDYGKWKGFHSDGRAIAASEWPLARSLLNGETVVGEDVEFVFADEAKGFLRLSSAPIRDAGGSIVAAVVICEDVTQLKLNERARIQLMAERQSSEAIRDSEVKLRSIFDSSFEAIITNDSKGRITEWNPKAEKMFLFKREEALGKAVDEMIIPPKYRQGFRRDTKKFFETGYGPLLNKTIEIEAIKKNGEVFPIQLSVSVSEKNGEYIFTSFIDDITERKKNERDLIAAKQEALDAAQARSQFLANMSHEIRTPLNGIIGLADLLQESSLSTEQKRMTGLIQDAGSNLLNIINDILDFSKIEAGHLSFEIVPFSLATLMENTAELLRYKVREKQLELSVHTDPRIPRNILGDPGRIGQVLINLVGNAVKFTKSGKINLRVELKNGDAHAPVLHFSVEDTGIGLSEESIKKLFRPFVQADGSTARKYGGTGLGLSISKRIVDLMHGQIGVKSELGKGSVFWFEVGLQAASLRPRRMRDEDKIQLLQADKRFRVLVAEDNSTNQLLALAQLKSLGYTAQAVANGKEAVEAFKTESFDLILMDCQMPEMDGFEATRAIRLLERSRQESIPIIALTANVMREDEEKCRAAGMDDFLAKPIKKEQLGDTLSKWLVSEQRKSA